MSAYFYQKGVMDDSVFYFAQGYVADAILRTYPHKEEFERAFNEACLVSYGRSHINNFNS